MAKAAASDKKGANTEREQKEGTISSSQGVRDFPIEKTKQKQTKNEDINDVYENISSNEPIHFNTNKEAISKPAVGKRKFNAKMTIDDNGRDFINHQYNTDIDTFTIEEKWEFVNKENEKLVVKVNQLVEGLKAVMNKMKSKKDSKPPQVFMK